MRVHVCVVVVGWYEVFCVNVMLRWVPLLGFAVFGVECTGAVRGPGGVGNRRGRSTGVSCSKFLFLWGVPGVWGE